MKRAVFLLLTTLWASSAGAASFVASVDRTEVGIDESIRLTLRLESDRSSFSGNEPEFEASGFDVVNRFDRNFTSATIVNGRITTVVSQEFIRVLQPNREGRLKITRLRVNAGGKTLTAPDIEVTVTAPGSGTPPPRGYSGGAGLKGSPSTTTGSPGSSSFFIKSEVSKSKVFKGEQLVVSYYLYTNVKVFNFEITRYPLLNGFIKKDLELPVLQRNPVFESVIFNGTSYHRALLARYAAYPLQEGALKIDPLELKFNYYSGYQTRGAFGGDDLFQQFFQNLSPMQTTKRSEIVNIEVEPVPMDGRPPSFGGGVGDFSIVAAINQYQVRAHEPLDLKVKIEGRGNVAALEEPQVKWPSDLELFNHKASVKMGDGGVGEKLFTYTLIPRSEGKMTIPAFEFSYFDPEKRRYFTQKTQPIELVVLTGDRMKTPDLVPEDQRAAIRPIRPPNPGEISFRGEPWWRWLYWAAAAVWIMILGYVLWDQYKKFRIEPLKRRNEALTYLKGFPETGNRADGFRRLSVMLLEELERLSGATLKGLSRQELRECLASHGLDATTIRRLEKILDRSDWVQFAGGQASSPDSLDSLGSVGSLAESLEEARAILGVTSRQINTITKL